MGDHLDGSILGEKPTYLVIDTSRTGTGFFGFFIFDIGAPIGILWGINIKRSSTRRHDEDLKVFHQQTY